MATDLQIWNTFLKLLLSPPNIWCSSQDMGKYSIIYDKHIKILRNYCLYLIRIRKVKLCCQNPPVEYIWGPRINDYIIGRVRLTPLFTMCSRMAILDCWKWSLIISPHLFWAGRCFLVCSCHHSLHKYLEMKSYLLWVHLNKIVLEAFIKLKQLERKRKTPMGLSLAGIVLLLLGTNAILLLNWSQNSEVSS